MAAGGAHLPARTVVVTDLDGSLLDFHDYSWEPARPALRLLKRRGIPVVFCSSKTRAELLHLQQRMEIADPFISETGGAIWFRPETTLRRPPHTRIIDGLHALVLGFAYRKLRAALVAYRTRHHLDVTGFGDLDADRAAELCDVPRSVAPLLLKRDFDEPFFFPAPPPEALLEHMRRHFARRGMRILRGGRFFHLVGPSDKGHAVRRLRRWYESLTAGPLTIIGLGDSPNDIELFAAADIPILIKRDNGRYDPTVRRTIKTRLAGDIGPAGWNRAILGLLGKT